MTDNHTTPPKIGPDGYLMGENISENRTIARNRETDAMEYADYPPQKEASTNLPTLRKQWRNPRTILIFIFLGILMFSFYNESESSIILFAIQTFLAFMLTLPYVLLFYISKHTGNKVYLKISNIFYAIIISTITIIYTVTFIILLATEGDIILSQIFLYHSIDEIKIFFNYIFSPTVFIFSSWFFFMKSISFKNMMNGKFYFKFFECMCLITITIACISILTTLAMD